MLHSFSRYLLLLLIIVISGTCAAQQFHLVRDINASTSSSPATDIVASAGSFPVVNGYAYFSANDGIHGRELWRSNGTANGTALVADIYPGENSSSPQYFTICNNKLFFTASTATSAGVWVSEGTAATTRQVFSGDQSFRNLTVADTVMYFTISDKIYKINSAATEASLVYDFSNNGGGFIDWMKNIHGKILFHGFSYNDPSGFNGNLWTTDGTAAGTFVVDKNIININNITEADSTSFYFAGSDKRDNAKRKLCIGNIGSTVSVDTVPVAADLLLNSYLSIIYFNHAVYFVGNTPEGENLLYRYSNKDNKGRQLLKKLTPAGFANAASLFTAGNHFYISSGFYQSDTTYQYQFWSSDGTAQHTIPLKTGFGISYLSDVEGALYFMGEDSLHGKEPWKSDGTVNGTVLLKDIVTGTGGSSGGAGSGFTKLGDKILFAAYSDKGVELWSTNGTGAGTLLLKDINETATSDSYAWPLTPYKKQAFFEGIENDEATPQIYKSDGTEAGTIYLKDFIPAKTYNRYNFPIRHDSLFVFGLKPSTAKKGLYAIDVNTSSLKLIKDFSASKEEIHWMGSDGGYIYFFTYLTFNSGWTLWRSDATTNGTIILASDSHQNENDYEEYRKPALSGNICYFLRAESGYNQLWRTDGTREGTFKLSGNDSLPFDAEPRFLNIYKGKLFFIASNKQGNSSVWTSDGTKQGTHLLPGEYANADNLTWAANKLFFSAQTSNLNVTIWSTDGSAAGTISLKAIYPGTHGILPVFKRAGGKLFFFSSNNTYGNELWKTDGTTEGTVVVKNLSPGNTTIMYPFNSVSNRQVISVAGKLCFAIQHQLWISDGSDTGTYKINDAGLKDITTVTQLSSVGNMLWFKGSSYKYGSEWYAGEVAPPLLNKYTFTGNGSLDNPANWLEGQVPPEDIYSGMEISIKPANGGEFILNQPLHFKGGKLTIAPGAKVTIPGELLTQ